MAMDERTLALRAEDVWLFTKQAMSFDTAFSAVRLLEEMPAGGGSGGTLGVVVRGRAVGAGPLRQRRDCTACPEGRAGPACTAG